MEGCAAWALDRSVEDAGVRVPEGANPPMAAQQAGYLHSR